MTDLRNNSDLRRSIGDQQLHCESLRSPTPLHIYLSLIIGAIIAVMYICHIAWLGDEVRATRKACAEVKK